MAVTIRDLSKKCGISVSAVSKALNGYPDVSEETRERVLKAAAEIGYRPNALARALKTNKTYNLGVILVDELHNSLLHTFFGVLLGGFRREAESRGYDITLINHNIGNREESYLNHCRYRNVDGICLMCVEFQMMEIQELVSSEIPSVAIDHFFSNKDCVLSDNREGVRALMDYVYSMGHRDIAFMYGTPSNVTDARLSAYYEKMREFKLPVNPEHVVQSHYHSTSHAQQDVQALLNTTPRPTCILMTDDYSALGGITAINQAGLRIPEDISVVGYDGTSLIQKIHPRLTTYRQDGDEIGRQAAIRLINRIENPDAPILPPAVVEGRMLIGETVKNLEEI